MAEDTSAMGLPPGMTQVFGYAMGSRFEIFLYGPDVELLVSAGNRALEEIITVEEALSHTIESSTLSWVNQAAAQQQVRVDPPFFELLEHSRQYAAETEGAFDVTVGALLRCWGFYRGQGKLPGTDEIAAALARTGWSHVRLDAKERTIQFDVDGFAIHMGGLGKGYALDRAAEALRDYGITSALLNGGKSSVVAIGAPPGQRGWRIGLPSPVEPARRLGVIVLRDCALSVSGAQEKYFEVDGKRYGHIIDPRTGWPADAVHLAAVVAGSGEETEAFSTGSAVLGPEGARRCLAHRRGIEAVLVPRSGTTVEPVVLKNPGTGRGDGAPDWVWEEGYHE